MIKKFLSPYITFYIFSIQFFIWMVFMPNSLNLELKKYGIANKYISNISIFRFLFFYLMFIFFIFIGTKIKFKSPKINFKYLNKYKNFLIVIWILAELISIRVLLFNPLKCLRLFLDGKFSIVLNLIRSQIFFTETLVNLFPLILSISLFFYFNSYKKRNNLFIIIIIFLGTLINGLFLFKRMHFVYFFLIIIYFLIKNKKIKFFKIIKYLIILAVLIIFGEMLRFGMLYAANEGKSLLSASVFKMVIHYLLTAYISSDFNNAMVIFNAESSYQLISTASPFFQKLLLKITGEFKTYNTIENWNSGYGTVNSLALWWYDFGIFTIIICLIMGIIIGIVYSNAKTLKNKYSNIQIIAPIIFIGNFMLFRFNSFLATAILIPIFFLMIYILFLNILIKK